MSVKELKIELKSLVSEIRKTKVEFKDFQRKNNGYGGSFHYTKEKLQYDFRHKHIAYCILKGRKYEEIERNCSRAGDPNWTYIQEITNEHKEIAEDVRACA